MHESSEHPDDILEPFFSYDEGDDLYSLCLVSNTDRRVLTLRLDEDSIITLYCKMGNFLQGTALVHEDEVRRRGITEGEDECHE